LGSDRPLKYDGVPTTAMLMSGPRRTAIISCGQTLIVTAGLGWTQCWGEAKEEIRRGDVITCPPGKKHWHGATPTTAMTHIAIQEPKDGKRVEWLELVTDERCGS